MSRTIKLSSPAMPYLLGEPALVLSKLEGEEAFSTLYSYTITAKTPANPSIPWQTASNVDLKALIGKEMTIEMELDGNGLDYVKGVGKGTREISGLVEKARFIGRDANQAMFEIVLRPWFYLTDLTSDFKIFQNKNVVDIIDEVLADYNFPFEKRLATTYPILDFQVQYGETDFNFLQRLMEEWGIYWFFEHDDHKQKLILVDHVGAHKRYFSEAYHTIEYLSDEPKAGEEYITQFQTQETLTTGRWVYNDYDFTKSRADILTMDSKPRKTSFSDLEIYQWPGDYDQPDIGEHLARVRIEERGALGSRAVGFGEVRGIVCGANFELQGFPVDKANREYMVISSRLLVSEVAQLSHGDEFHYETTFSVQPTTKIYRHPQLTPKPKTSGPQNAIVVGPPGEEVWTDEYGRVKVRFVWDRYGKNAESDSCWLRVSQAWAGNSFGGIYIPRIGQEVLVDCINGDPDRPLVSGSLYNNVTRPPWDLPANATQSGMVSRTIGGGLTNYNGVRFEDKPGLEQYWEQAERDMARLTKNDETQVIGANADLSVGANRSVLVGANSTSTVLGASAQSVALASSIQVGLARSVVVGATHALNVALANATNVGGANLTNVGGYNALSVGGAHQVAAGGAATLVAGGAVAIGAGGELVLSADTIKIVGKKKVIIQGGEIHLNSDDCCGGGGGGAGGGLAALSSLAGLKLLGGGIGLPLPLPPLPIPPIIPPTPSIDPSIPPIDPPEPTTDTPEPTTETPEPTVTPEPTDTPEPT
ncbi:TPA: type VI secretion system tip protein VgrG, partial [Yersinia enterocolitica]|nr:type VI secretion system tip protein VgrG [Yersinia enterocolitica]